MKVISIVNPKGGAGKTVTAVNLAYAMSLKGKKILLIDTDPRNAVSTYLNLKNDNTIFDLIKECYETMKFDKAKYITSKNKVDVIIPDEKLLQLEMLFASYSDNQAIFNIFSNITEQLKQDYDYIIIDTEGSINNTVRGILNATDYIVAPSKCSLIDTNGINDLIKIYFIGKRNNPKLELKKVFFVQVEERTRVFADALKEYTDFFNKFPNVTNSVKESIVVEILKFSEEYREQLLAYAYNLYLQNGASSIKYIVTTLQEWSDNNVTSLADARKLHDDTYGPSYEPLPNPDDVEISPEFEAAMNLWSDKQ